MMIARDVEIVQAARTVFARYGFGKTTMADIAAEAGVARQTLYNAFPGKEEILRAAVRLTGEETLEAVKLGWREADSLEEKLTIFLELGPIAWFEAIRAAPDLAELLDGVHGTAAEELRVMGQQWKAALNAMLAASNAAPSDPDLTLDDVTEFFYSASKNAKYGAEDIDHLRQRLETIKAATLALLR